jgi:tetratricopeptide (TPR) repeat protein
MRRCVLAALVACALFSGAAGTRRAASAQTYPAASPAPRTTDAAILHAFAVEREINERIRLGIEAETRHDWNAAVEEFGRALALAPREPQASTSYYDLGIAQAGLADYAAAAASFREAIARDPGFLAARANLTAVELAAGNVPGARAAADAFVKAAPQSARALYSRGIAALRSGDAATALSDFGKLLARDPAYAVAHYDLALAEQQQGRFDEAERELKTALALAPTYVRAHLALGAVLLREGKRSDARAMFDAAARLASEPALHNLAVSLRDAIAEPR